MNYQEQPHVFNCRDCRLIGITTLANQASKLGVLIIVGGPQYRSGSHRQFTLLARYLANNGIPTFRFDYRGMGDSEGEIRSFENIHDDIHAAINAFVLSSESLTRIVIWGLCDAASATLLYAQTDSRVVGIILLNPWVHTTKSADQIKLKYYYLPRLLKQSFWSKLFHGNIGIMGTLNEVTDTIIRMLKNKLLHKKTSRHPSRHENLSFIEGMLKGLTNFHGKVLIILSENDLISQEFQQLINTNKRWALVCANAKIDKELIKNANHTFSSSLWRSKVNDVTLDWLNRNKDIFEK